MFKRLLFLVALMLGGASAASAAGVAVATANVNMRAGPSTSYPVVAVVPAGTRVATYGCVANFSWCDVGFGHFRGWVSAAYMQVAYNGAPVVLTPAVATAVGVSVVTFSKAYWDTYYVAYPWYGRWNRYVYAAPPPARVTSYSRTAGCVDGTCTGTRSVTGVYGGSASQTRSCSGGECSATRNVNGPYGYSASRTRSCSANDLSCTVSRSGPRGGTSSRTRSFAR